MYIAGFVIPVPEDKMEAYRKWAENGAAIFKEYGCVEIVESWEDNVPTGKYTDFRRAVQAKPDETVVFAFLEWPSKAVNDGAWDRIMKDERMQPSPDVPFDGKRMFWGAFDVILDTAKSREPAAAEA